MRKIRRALIRFVPKKRSYFEVERNLINADELMKLPRDQMLILSQGFPPYVGKKCVYYDDARFKHKYSQETAFSTYADALKQSEGSAARVKDAWFALPDEAVLHVETACEDAPEERDPFGFGAEAAETASFKNRLLLVPSNT